MNPAPSLKPIYIPLFIIAFVLVIGNVLVSANLSTTGEKIKDLEAEKQLLSEENLELRRSILENSSLKKLETQAEAAGFDKPSDIISLETPAPVALSDN